MASFSLNNNNNKHHNDTFLVFIAFLLFMLFLFIGKSCTANAQILMPHQVYQCIHDDNETEFITWYTFGDSLYINDFPMQYQINYKNHTLSFMTSGHTCDIYTYTIYPYCYGKCFAINLIYHASITIPFKNATYGDECDIAWLEPVWLNFDESYQGKFI